MSPRGLRVAASTRKPEPLREFRDAFAKCSEDKVIVNPVMVTSNQVAHPGDLHPFNICMLVFE